MRIGHGYDAHKFSDGSGLVLGGVSIEYTRSLAAHSDGDVLIHALCDALLGAAALGDIGRHFPDTSDEFKDINSRILLRHVMELLGKAGLAIANADMTIIAQAPKLAVHLPAMCANLASDLGVDVSQVNIKATTTEKMGFAGREVGIAAHAVVLLENS